MTNDIKLFLNQICFLICDIALDKILLHEKRINNVYMLDINHATSISECLLSKNK